MFRGLLSYLLADTASRRPRGAFVFKLVPMLNPDGVINGNYRCSLAGVDLNRRYHRPSAQLHPEIFHLKRLLGQVRDQRGIFLYLDLHGHSRKKNVFLYGCDLAGEGELDQRLAPRHVGAHRDKYFSYPDCSFAVQRSKHATGRVVARREFGVVNAFTLESSFCG
ncbi:unnamed protein product, partial [Heterosigma akashiwo]